MHRINKILTNISASDILNIPKDDILHTDILLYGISMVIQVFIRAKLWESGR